LLGKGGMLGVEVRPVAIMSFLQVNAVPVHVSTFHRLSTFVTFDTGDSKIMRSLIVFPAKVLCIEKASRYEATL